MVAGTFKVSVASVVEVVIAVPSDRHYGGQEGRLAVALRDCGRARMAAGQGIW